MQGTHHRLSLCSMLPARPCTLACVGRSGAHLALRAGLAGHARNSRVADPVAGQMLTVTWFKLKSKGSGESEVVEVEANECTEVLYARRGLRR